MPRIHPNFLECVCYFYPTIAAAESGENADGTGFVIGIPAETVDGNFLYVVTNKHVIEGVFNKSDPARVLRFNKTSGEVGIAETSIDNWVRHEDDDIALGHLTINDSLLNIAHVPISQFVTEEIIQEYAIGPGDNVFMVGRFAYHEGKEKNIPSVRFGNISMMNDEKVKHESGLWVDSIMVEMRSIGGYSGSPVFVYFEAFEGRPRLDGAKSPTHIIIKKNGIEAENIGPLLLGVNWGHLPRTVRMHDKDTGKPYLFKDTSNMATVAPAWKILEILERSEMNMIREDAEKRKRHR